MPPHNYGDGPGSGRNPNPPPPPPNLYKRGYWRVFKKTKDIIKKKYKYNKLNESQVEKLKHITELLRDL